MRPFIVLLGMLLFLPACAKVVATEAAVVESVKPFVDEKGSCWRSGSSNDRNPDGKPHHCSMRLRVNDLTFLYSSVDYHVDPCVFDGPREKCMAMHEKDVIEVKKMDDGTHVWQVGRSRVILH